MNRFQRFLVNYVPAWLPAVCIVAIASCAAARGADKPIDPAVALAWAAPAKPDRFTATNGVTYEKGADGHYRAVAEAPAKSEAKPACFSCSSCGDACRCFGGQYYCAEGKCSAEKPLKPGQSFTTRAPVGHTHTCANGHTWDHSANATHTCQFCGLSQYIQDPVARPVTVKAAAVATPTTEPLQAVFPHQTYALPGATAGGCANGNCPAPQQSRPALFLRLRGQ